jgi:hypothetical protein
LIKITVELVSANGRERDRLLGIGLISNIGGDAQRGNYDVWLSKWAPRERQAWKTGQFVPDGELAALVDGLSAPVSNFDRERRGAWDLLYLALRAIVGDRNR